MLIIIIISKIMPSGKGATSRGTRTGFSLKSLVPPAQQTAGQQTNEAKHQNFPVPRGVDGSRTIEVYPLVLDVKDLAWAQR